MLLSSGERSEFPRNKTEASQDSIIHHLRLNSLGYSVVSESGHILSLAVPTFIANKFGNRIKYYLVKNVKETVVQKNVYRNDDN